MAFKRLGKATYVQRGYGQIEANHLSGQATRELYAQLPAAADIDLLENGMFAKYDYENGVVNFTGDGDWMLVFNEPKWYRDREVKHDFAMVKDNYNARIYSPVDGDSMTSAIVGNEDAMNDAPAVGPYNDPLYAEGAPYRIYNWTEKQMPEGTTMVPRLMATKVGDHFTTNTIMETTLAVGDKLTPGADGYLAKAGADAADFVWKVVKVYTMPDM